MATYYIVKTSPSSTFEADADAYFRAHEEYTLVSGDIAHYCTTETHEVILKTYKFWRKDSEDNLVWMFQVDSFTPKELNVGHAQDFRGNLNSNFNSMETQANDVNQNLITLESNLSPVATSGLASDIIQTEERNFVSNQQKSNWTQRLWIGTPAGGTPGIYWWDSNALTPQNVTNDIKNLLTIVTPTQTSQIENNSGFISAAGYVSPTILTVQNYVVEQVVPDSTYSSRGFYYKGSITLQGCTSDMVGEIIFSQADAQSGEYSQICETGNNVIYYWSVHNTQPTISMVLAYSQSVITH